MTGALGGGPFLCRSVCALLCPSVPFRGTPCMQDGRRVIVASDGAVIRASLGYHRVGRSGSTVSLFDGAFPGMEPEGPRAQEGSIGDDSGPEPGVSDAVPALGDGEAELLGVQ